MSDELKLHILKIKKFHSLSLELIGLADRGTLIIDFLRDISEKIIKFSNAGRLNIIINDISNFYRFSLDSDEELNITQLSDFAVTHENLLDSHGGIPVESLEKLVFFRKLYDSPFITEGSGLIIHDTSKNIPLTVRAGDEVKSFEARTVTPFPSILILPIRISEEVIGTVSLEWGKTGVPGKNEIELYQYLFDIVGYSRSHRQAKFHLGERIKELTTIYQITRLGSQINKSLDDVLTAAADIIPPGFLQPEFACCKIEYADEVFKSRNYQVPKDTLREDIVVGGEIVGFVEVGYTRSLTNLDKGPFLLEEQPMLMTVARELSLVAERKHFEEEREKLQQQLLHADRLVTVGQLTAGVAHEINEPLGGILGFAQLIKKYGGVDEGVERDIDKIIRASLHAREIIRKLMLFSRQTPPEKIFFNINERIDDGLDLLDSRLKKNNIIVKKELSDSLPLIKIDPSQLHQVFVNLVVNAIQAMPDGGTLTIQTEKSINTISLTVKDTGVGMTEEQIDKIFIPFYTTKGVNEGTGLGLPVVMGIVQAHGGSINVESSPGGGSMFVVKLPINSSPETEKGEDNA